VREVRQKMSQLLSETAQGGEPIIITRHGRPVGYLINYQAFNRLLERLEDLEDIRAIQEAEASQRTDKGRDFEEFGEARPLSPLEREKQVFERMRTELVQQHCGQVIAIYQGKVIQVSDEGETLADFAIRVYKRIGYLPIYFQRIEDKLPVYRFPYFKVVR